MPALDKFHDAVCNALKKEGWTITHDPLTIKVDNRRVFVDVGAERILGAEKWTQKIAVEIKTFTGRSEVHDLWDALGQFVAYRELLAEIEPERIVFVAVPQLTLEGIFQERIGQILVRRLEIDFLSYDADSEVIMTWSKIL
jgi:hypothetical protein